MARTYVKTGKPRGRPKTVIEDGQKLAPVYVPEDDMTIADYIASKTRNGKWIVDQWLKVSRSPGTTKYTAQQKLAALNNLAERLLGKSPIGDTIDGDIDIVIGNDDDSIIDGIE